MPDDEADDVRSLLNEHQIEFYETSPGNWGISMPAIWINDESQFLKAKALLDEYQAARSKRVREAYARLKKEGKHKTVMDSFRENPFGFIAYVFIVIVLLYLPFKLILDLGKE